MPQSVAGCLGDCAVFDAGIPAGVRGRVGRRRQERHSLRFERPAMNAPMSSTASRLLAICFFAGCSQRLICRPRSGLTSAISMSPIRRLTAVAFGFLWLDDGRFGLRFSSTTAGTSRTY